MRAIASAKSSATERTCNCGQPSGVGGSLYAAAEALCRADGIRVIIGVVAQPNPASNALHERLGFRAAGELDGVGFKFDRWLGIRFYQRDLA